MRKQKQRKNVETTFDFFLERLSLLLGPFLFREVEKTFVKRPPTFRMNSLKSLSFSHWQDIKDGWLAEVRQEGFKLKRVSWYGDAFVLENRSKREFTKLLAYEEGKIYMQSLASMVPPLVLDPRPGEKVLDLTAAPGSKTSQMVAMMKKKGELLANDKNRVRFFKLKHNMEKLGVTFSSQYHSDFNDQGEVGWLFTLRMEHGVTLCRDYHAYFDKILLDAPCSAEARFCREDPKTYGYWNERKIKEMAYTQRQLLFSAWQALRSGGVLVYSTCTFAPEENEVQISRFLERTEDAVALPIVISGLESIPVLREWKGKSFHPAVSHCFRIKPTKEIEGFFVAKFIKR